MPDAPRAAMCVTFGAGMRQKGIDMYIAVHLFVGLNLITDERELVLCRTTSHVSSGLFSSGGLCVRSIHSPLKRRF